MDTRTFVGVWKSHIRSSDKNDWNMFCESVFEQFTSDSESANLQYLVEYDKNWKKWQEGDRYAFISEKAYSKAINIRKELRKLTPPVNVELPNGYRERNGHRSNRVTMKEIAHLFMED